MNRDFLSNFEPLSQKGPEKIDDEATDDSTIIAEYAPHDHVRNLRLYWPDGSQAFLNYARLDSGEINPERTATKFTFGNDTLEMIGLNLVDLYESILDHRRKVVGADDARYNALKDDGLEVVNEIIISARS